MTTTFDELLAARLAHADAFAASVLEYQRQLNTAWIEAARAKWPNRRRIDTVERALKLLTYVESSAVKEPFEVESETTYAAWVVERDRLDTELRQFAATEPFSDPQERTAWIVWKRVSISTYYSQGFGAERYALACAEGEADVARLYGVEVRVTPSDREYLVEVLVAAQRDIEILTRRPGLSMREQIKAALKRGANVRVLNPYLPHGLEAKLGLDYFGNDLPGYTGER